MTKKPLERPVQLPESANPEHPVVLALSPRLSNFEIGKQSYDRVLRLHQGLANEIERRGHSWLVPKDGDKSLSINIRDVEFTVHLNEEQDIVNAADESDIKSIKYDWQRARLHQTTRWSGRLVLALEHGSWRPARWADRSRWTLESRLPKVLHAAEVRAEEVLRQREAADRAKQERLRQWEAAVPKAQAAYLEALNRERLNTQFDSHARATQLRSYANAVIAAAKSQTKDQRVKAAEWVAWIRREADRVDPLLDLAQLRYERPETLPVEGVDRYMPKGMTSRRPPD